GCMTDSNSFFTRERSMAMKKLVSISVCFAFSLTAQAQAPNPSKGQGYVFFAPGIGNPYRQTRHFGAGGEGFIYKGLGIGAEIGPVGPWSTPRDGGWTDYVIGLGSANFSYHFFPGTADTELEPFVTAGYSMFFRHGT